MTLPKNQFSLPGFKAAIRLDRTLNSGGLLVLINEKITSQQIKTITIPGDIQAVPIELNINNSKWLLLPINRLAKTRLTSLMKCKRLSTFVLNRYKTYFFLEISTWILLTIRFRLLSIVMACLV